MLLRDADDATTVAVLRAVAEKYETEGRKALGACCIGVGTALRRAAAAVERCAQMIDLLAATGDRSFFAYEAIAAFRAAHDALRDVAGFFTWDRDTIQTYRREIARRRAQAVTQRPARAALPTREPERLPLYQAEPLPRRPRLASKQSRRMRSHEHRALREPRRYLVKEVVSSMSWTGTVWASACSTRDSALRSFDRRLVRNQHEGNEDALVVAFDREKKTVLAATWNISKPEVRLWCQ